MGYDQQKLDEKAWFSQFISLTGGFEQAEQFDQPPEPAPDIVVPRLGLGVEITEAFQDGGDVRKREGEERSTLGLAERLYHEAGHPPVDVTVHWSAHHSPTARTRERLAEALVECVLSNLPTNEPGRRVDIQHQDELPLVSLSLHRLAPGYEPYWRASRGAFPRHCDPQVIQERISRKLRKVSA